MKHIVMFFFAASFLGSIVAQELKPVTLLAPDMTRGSSLMKALEARSSAREFSTKKLSIQDLSDLLWAANGMNRPAEGKKTAPSAINAQDVDIYVFLEEGVYIYDAAKSLLNPVVSGDHREYPGKTDAPVTLVLISDISRFVRRPAATAPTAAAPAADPTAAAPVSRPASGFTDAVKIGWANLDAGTISQNISLFCAANGMNTVPKASFPGMAAIREILKLKETQLILLHHPVGYPKE